MIPYLPAPSLEVGGLRFHAFGLMVGLAMLVGVSMYLRRSRQQGLDAGFARLFIFSVATGGYLTAHLAHVLIFAPEVTWSRVFDFTGSIYSFGGVVGGCLIGWLMFSLFGVAPGERRRHLDNLAFSFVTGWIFGRAGCTLAHDHLGPPSTSFLAIRFPGGPRYDLGLLELLFTLLLAAIFFWLDRNPHRRGHYLPAFLITYGTFRLWRDTLEVSLSWHGISLDSAMAAALLAGGIMAGAMRSIKREAS